MESLHFERVCSQCGPPISGKCKDELVALAYAATVAKLPCVLSRNDECVLVAAEYQQLLTVGEAVMPDPLTELTVGWQSQEDGIKNKDLFIVPVVVNMGKCCALSRSRIREGSGYGYGTVPGVRWAIDTEGSPR